MRRSPTPMGMGTAIYPIMIMVMMENTVHMILPMQTMARNPMITLMVRQIHDRFHDNAAFL